MAPGLAVHLGDLALRSPLVAASGTVGSVWEWADIADVSVFGAAVAKSVAPEEWARRPQPRVAPTSTGMLNGIGIQNPGITAWVETMKPIIPKLGVPTWGSAVAGDAEGFAIVAKQLADAGVAAVELNLSCPNLEEGHLFSFSDSASAAVVAAARSAVTVPIGAKLSPNTPQVVDVAEACLAAGADYLVLTNTALGFGLDVETGRPLLSGGVGGYSGPGLKPISLRCVYEVAQALPEARIVGCGGISTGRDVMEYLMAGASAVEVGTVLLAEPDAGKRISRELTDELSRLGADSVSDITGSAESW